MDAADVLISYCESQRYPVPVREYLFAQPRKFRADLCWPGLQVILEIDGGIFGRGKPCPVCGRRRGGAHSSIADLKRDQERRNAAALLGYRMLSVRPDQVQSGEAFSLLDRLFGGKES